MTSSPPPEAPRPPGPAGSDPSPARRQIGPYRLEGVIGRGGMGRVYQAWDERLQRRVALKVLLPELTEYLDFRERFLREARAAAAITHDHVVTIYDVGQDGEVPYFAMQLLQGASLDGYLAIEGTPTISEALRIAREIASGLAAAHQRGLIHRDIKPANIWLEGAGRRVKLLDFGLALPVAANTRLTQPGMVVGTPGSMSPEQASGQAVDHRTDLFSLGVILYELCTGRAPFRAGSTAEGAALAFGGPPADEPPDLSITHPHVARPVIDLIERLLARDPADRPGSAAEVVESIQRIEQDLAKVTATPARSSAPTQVTFAAPAVVAPPLPPPSEPSPPPRRPRRRPVPSPRARVSPWVIGIVAGLSLGAVVTLIAVVVVATREPTAPTTSARAPAPRGPWPMKPDGTPEDPEKVRPFPGLPDGPPWPVLPGGIPVPSDENGWPQPGPWPRGPDGRPRRLEPGEEPPPLPGNRPWPRDPWGQPLFPLPNGWPPPLPMPPGKGGFDH